MTIKVFKFNHNSFVKKQVKTPSFELYIKINGFVVNIFWESVINKSLEKLEPYTFPCYFDTSTGSV